MFVDMFAEHGLQLLDISPLLCFFCVHCECMYSGISRPFPTYVHSNEPLRQPWTCSHQLYLMQILIIILMTS